MILLIRHAEKPAGGQRGVTESGEQSDKSLTVRGWQRAGALAAAAGRLFPAPQHLFASHSSSARPHETLIPLAGKLGLHINLDYGKGGERNLVDTARKQDGVVMICWQHEYMSAVANALLGDTGTAPQTWPEVRFDVVWRFDFDSTARVYRFCQVPQLLLQGDSSDPIL